MKQARDALAGHAEVRCRSDTIPASAISAIGEDADADGSEPSAEPMHRDSAARIIDLGHPLIEEDTQTDYDSGENADDHCGRWRDKSTRSCDRDKTGEHPVTRHGDI